MSVFVTGGAGFIGANFVLDWIANNDEAIVNIDNLTPKGRPHVRTVSGHHLLSRRISGLVYSLY